MPDRLIIEGDRVLLETEEGQRAEHPRALLESMLVAESLPPLGGRLLPDGVKALRWAPPYLLVVHQYPPHVRRLRWIADDSPEPYGPEARYREVRVGLPYTVHFAVFRLRRSRLRLGGQNELYFRNAPLESDSDALGYPALLNVSRIDTLQRRRAWICTQHLEVPLQLDWTEQLGLLLRHTWDGSLNLSSDIHEVSSWYSESRGIHPDLHPVERWQAATQRDERFALEVPWMPVPLRFNDLCEAVLAESRGTDPVPGGGASLDVFAAGRRPGIVERFMRHVLRDGGAPPGGSVRR